MRTGTQRSGVEPETPRVESTLDIIDSLFRDRARLMLCPRDAALSIFDLSSLQSRSSFLWWLTLCRSSRLEAPSIYDCVRTRPPVQSKSAAAGLERSIAFPRSTPPASSAIVLPDRRLLPLPCVLPLALRALIPSSGSETLGARGSASSAAAAAHVRREIWRGMELQCNWVDCEYCTVHVLRAHQCSS